MRVESKTPMAYGRLSVRANFAWVAASTVLFQMCQWLMLATLARSAGSSAVGIFAFALAVTSPPILLANLNLRIVLATDVRSEFVFLEYLTLRICSLLVSLAAVFVAVLLFCRSAGEAELIVAVALAKTFDSVSDIVYGLLQKYEKMDRIAVSRLAQGVLQFFALFFSFQVTHDLLSAVLAWTAMSAAITLSYDLRSVFLIRRKWPGEMSRTSLRRPFSRIGELFRISLPLAGTAALGALISNIPVYALNHWRTPGEVGVFSAQMRLVTVISLAFAALVQASTPRLAHYFTEKNEGFFRLLRLMIAAALVNGMCGLVVVLLGGRMLLRLLYGAEYEDEGLLVILVLAVALNLVSVVLGMAVSAARIFKIQFWIGLVQLAVTVGFLIILTPNMGARGAAIAFLVGICVYSSLLGVAISEIITPRGWGLRGKHSAARKNPVPRGYRRNLVERRALPSVSASSLPTSDEATAPAVTGDEKIKGEAEDEDLESIM